MPERANDERLMAVLLEWWCQQELTMEEFENTSEREVGLADMTDLLDLLAERGYCIVAMGPIA